MTCLVTGGAGFIGSNLVDKLVALGHKVTVLDNLSTGSRANLRQEIVVEDITNNLDKLFLEGKFDVVFHLAANPRVQQSIQDPRGSHETNINGTFNLLEMCRTFKVKRFIFSSSCSVYGDQSTLPLVETMIPNPMSPYALGKLTGEHYCQLYNFLYGIETICLRYFNVYGPRQNPGGGYANLIPKFIKMFKENTPPTINGNAGKHTRDYIFVSDVVNANIAALDCQNKNSFGKVFNVGLGKSYSVDEVAQKLIEELKTSIKPVYGPDVVEPKDTLADFTLIKKYLGWEPRVSFEEGLRMTVEYFSKNTSLTAAR